MNPQKNEIMQKLKMISVFVDFKDNDLAMNKLADIIKVKRVPANEHIIKEGDLGSEMYILFNGDAEILKKTRAGDDYTVVKLNASMNVFFGELALIDDDKRSATVTAVSDCTLLTIDKGDFIKLGDVHPELGLPVTRAISKILANRLRKTTQDMLTIFDALVNEIRG